MRVLLTEKERKKYCEVSVVQISGPDGTYDAEWKYWDIDGLLKAQLKKLAKLIKKDTSDNLFGLSDKLYKALLGEAE